MAADRIDPREQIPEADRVEQQAPLDPHSLTEMPTAITDTIHDMADEADWLDQHTVVFSDQDDYPHEPAVAGWS